MRAALLIVLMAFAGCSSAPVATTLSTCEESSCQATVVLENETAPTEFALRGVVVDQLIVPVPRADVELRKLDKPLASVTADDQGAFTFHGLSEGFYNLFVDKDGHTGVLANFYVQEGMRQALVQIVRVPEPVPTHSLSVWDGMVDCSYLVANFGLTGICPHEFVTGSSNQTSWRSFYDEVAGRDPDWVQAEMYWESNQAAGDTLRMRAYAVDANDRRTSLGSVVGGAPLVFSQDRAAMSESGVGTDRGLYISASGGNPEMASISVVQDQPFTVYLSVLENLSPPEGWMFVTDGALT